MLDNLKTFIDLKKSYVRDWSNANLINLFLFNIAIAVMLLLHSAGYFAPYFPITINLVVLMSLILSIFLLGATSQAIFAISLLFWVFAGLLKVLGVDVWAERTTVYCFEAFVLGVILMFVRKNG